MVNVNDSALLICNLISAFSMKKSPWNFNWSQKTHFMLSLHIALLLVYSENHSHQSLGVNFLGPPLSYYIQMIVNTLYENDVYGRAIRQNIVFYLRTLNCIICKKMLYYMWGKIFIKRYFKTQYHIDDTIKVLCYMICHVKQYDIV